MLLKTATVMGMGYSAAAKHKNVDDGRESEGQSCAGYSAHKGDDVTKATGLDEGKPTCRR